MVARIPSRERCRLPKSVFAALLLACVLGCQVPQYLTGGKIAQPNPTVAHTSDASVLPAPTSSVQVVAYSQPAAQLQGNTSPANHEGQPQLAINKTDDVP